MNERIHGESPRESRAAALGRKLVIDAGRGGNSSNMAAKNEGLAMKKKWKWLPLETRKKMHHRVLELRRHCERCIAMFIRGLADAEGTVNKHEAILGYTQIANTDQRLIQYAAELLTRLKIHSRIYEKTIKRDIVIKGRRYKRRRSIIYLISHTTKSLNKEVQGHHRVLNQEETRNTGNGQVALGQPLPYS